MTTKPIQIKIRATIINYSKIYINILVEKNKPKVLSEITIKKGIEIFQYTSNQKNS